MPKGTKVCKSCNHITGPRSFSCPKCGASFDMKLSAKKKVVRSKKKVKNKEKASPKVGESPSKVSTKKKQYICIPAGECPVKLTDLTPEGVIAWRDKIIKKSPDIIYQPSAFKYWLRDFVPIFSDLWFDLSFVL